MDKEKVNLLLGERTLQQLNQIAGDLGLLWRGKPSLSAVMEAIAKRTLPVDWSVAEQTELHQAVIAAAEAGYSVANIAETLSAHLAFPEQVRKELAEIAIRDSAPWIQGIQELIDQKQPFCLEYPKPNGEISVHTMKYARLEVVERHRYLCAWVDEADEQSLPELAHNRYFRLDRMAAAVVSPIKGQWKGGLGEALICFHLFAGLAHNYNAKPQDTEDSWLSYAPPQRRITRKISSSLWALRELRVYGGNAQLIAPDQLVQQFLDDQHQLLKRYQ